MTTDELSTFEVRLLIRAENESDAIELLECFEETDIKVLSVTNADTIKHLLATKLNNFETALKEIE